MFCFLLTDTCHPVHLHQFCSEVQMECSLCHKTYKSAKTLKNHKCPWCSKCNWIYSSFQRFQQHKCKFPDNQNNQTCTSITPPSSTGTSTPLNSCVVPAINSQSKTSHSSYAEAVKSCGHANSCKFQSAPFSSVSTQSGLPSHSQSQHLQHTKKHGLLKQHAISYGNKSVANSCHCH